MAEVAVVGKVRARGQDEDADGDGTAPPPAKVAKVDDDGENAASGDPDVDPDADAADDGDDGAPTRRSLRSRNPPRPRRGGKGANENGAPSSNGKADGAANTKEEEAAVLFPGVEYDGESPGGRAALVAWLRKKTSVGSLTEVHVAGAALGRAVHSRPVRSRQLWGTQVYTDDSDLVAVLIHLGFLNPALLDAVASDVRRLEVVLKTLPGQATYPSTHANGMRSRCWRVPPMAHEAARRSFTVKSCTAVVPSGSGQQGPSAPAGGRKDAAAARPPASDDAETRLTLWPAPGLFAIPNPTVVPSAAEKVVNTRSSAASAERKSKFLQEVTLQYNLCNEPWLKYVTSAVSDQGLEPSEWTSARMHREVIFVEGKTHRYQLALQAPLAAPGGKGGKASKGNSAATKEEDRKEGAEEPERYAWARCKRIVTMSEMRRCGVPFTGDHVEVLARDLAWEELQWAPGGVRIQSEFYPLCRIHFMPKTSE